MEKKIVFLINFILSLSVLSQNVGIGSESFTPDQSAVLELKSTEQGFLPPRMTTAERDGIQNPVNGLIIFNSTTNCINYYANTMWYDVCGSCKPDSPIPGIHSISGNQIIWNWQAVPNVDGYKYNTINDFSSATDNGTSTSFTQTGLNPLTNYVLYIWAYNQCGASNFQVLSATTGCPVFNIGDNYGGGKIAYTNYPNSTCGYLISTTSDQSAGSQWGCNGTNYGALGENIGDGYANTYVYATNCTATNICRNLSIGSYDDWFLPSVNELLQLYTNQNAIGGFPTGQSNYWSSSEWYSVHAKIVGFHNGYINVQAKTDTFRVRCVRAF